MASTSAAEGKPIFNSSAAPKRPINALRQDRYMRHGKQVLAASNGSDILERLLASCRALCELLADIVRPSSDFQDTPVTILGQHYMSMRELGARPDASRNRLYIQEICSFDAAERPRFFQTEGSPLATFQLKVAPRARAKVKRLGNVQEAKVALEGGGKLHLLRHAETYEFSLPNLVLANPLTAACGVGFKGEVVVKCAASGLMATMVFDKANGVSGTVEQLAGEATVQIGVLSGNWREQITVQCPGLGLDGVVYSAAAHANLPPPLQQLDLSTLGPMQMPRLWSALHDALMFNKPTDAVGGRPARVVARKLSHHLKGLTLEGTQARDSSVTSSKAGGDSSSDDSDAEEGEGGEQLPVPPSVRAHKAEGHSLTYQLHYAVSVVSGGVLAGLAA